MDETSAVDAARRVLSARQVRSVKKRRGPNARQHVGARGEDLAAAELVRQGMQIVARNWRCALGELDIIALEEQGGRHTIVFCEVKCRTGLGYGSPLESITHAKLRKLRQLSSHWLATEHRPDAASSDAARLDAIRLDAVGVVMMPGREPELTHVRGIG